MPGSASLGTARSPAVPGKWGLKGSQGCSILQGRAVGNWGLGQGVRLRSSSAIQTSVTGPKCVQNSVGVTNAKKSSED